MNPMQPNQQPQRTSQPMQPGQTPPNETPASPDTEYERNVPHTTDQPVAQTGKHGEGSYEGTKQYDQGLEEFGKKNPPDESVRRGKQIDTDDPALREAEKRAKAGDTGRVSTPSSS
jgi:hypothetical protein